VESCPSEELGEEVLGWSVARDAPKGAIEKDFFLVHLMICSTH